MGRRAAVNAAGRAMERAEQKQKRLMELFFEPGAAPEPDQGGFVDPLLEDIWTDRVSKDLVIPYHKVGVSEFEEWERRGFPMAKKGEFCNMTEQVSLSFQLATCE